MGSDCYQVPSKYINNTKLLKDPDQYDNSTKEISLNFDAEYIQEFIPEYSLAYKGRSSLVDGSLSIVIASLSDENILYILSKEHYSDLWTGDGSYAEDRLGQHVEFDEKINLHKVRYEKAPKGWKYTDVNPVQITEKENWGNVIAGCRERNTFTGKSYSCIHKKVSGNISVKYWVPEENFHLYEKIDDFILGQLSSWKSLSCKTD